MKPHNEIVFETDIVRDLISSPETLFSRPYIEGNPENFDAELGLYPEDLIAYIKTTQSEEYEKLAKKQGSDKADVHLLREVSRYMDTNGCIHSLRRGIEFVGSKFRLVQFQPDNLSNQKAKDQYDANILRVVRQIRYSPYHQEMLTKTGHGSGIIDLVIFLNGIPVASLELKTDFTQSVHHAIQQYKKDRLPLNPVTRKPEPLLSFNKRCIVHFAVSTEEVYMTTKLEGENTLFLPFNRGNGDGAGNSPNPNGYASSYLWEEVLEKETFLRILGRFVHLQNKDTEGRKLKPEQHTIIFPRYHQLDAVKKLIATATSEGPGHRYLIQHSAGSGKSNSIAWLTHQLASLTVQKGAKQGERLFRNIIVITDRTVLDSQLQDTIYQFDHQTGVVNRITREEGSGSKSQQLTEALTGNSPIIIVTIQTFPYILEAIQKETSLKNHTFAVIADEAHSSQTGKTASKLKEVLQAELKDEEELSAEDILRMSVESRKTAKNISYFAFTATPKPATLEIFGRLKFPDQPKSKENTPVAFHVYTMQQAIEEGYILNVLKNYTTYDVAYKIANQSRDKEVDAKKAKSKINTWVRLHPHNITQKIAIIVEHYRSNIRHMLDGAAKAMVVTGSRKEAVRYKIELDKYLKEKNYSDIHALVAFSGDVIDEEYANFAHKANTKDPFTERNMNPDLKGEDIRTAFDNDAFQILLVANKFLTGFDQAKLCAMYIDKTLSGVDCVQALSRLNRVYPGKEKITFILDFVNKITDIVEAFSPFYKTTSLSDNSDPNAIFAIKNALLDARIFTLEQVEEFAKEYFSQAENIRNKKKSEITQKKLNSIIQNPKLVFKTRYTNALNEIRNANEIIEQAKQSKNNTSIQDVQKHLNSMKEIKSELDRFKSGVNKFIDLYEFMTNIVDYDSQELEKLYVFLKFLKELLKIEDLDEGISLAGLVLSHFRIHRKQIWNPKLDQKELDPDSTTISAGMDKKKELLSEIIDSINELFDGDVSESDAIEKLNSFGLSLEPEIMKNEEVMNQMKAGNSKEQIMLGDYPKALTHAIMNTLTTNNDLSSRLLSNNLLMDKFARSILEVFIENLKQTGNT
ncbi:type I restriction endonuclease subunit R [Leptospira dzoumogneensis]|uniref:Type I restriction endonuclease subunit R n=2 Tax=Leptospira dzoumogneensis TaxID=2484904 RepID=A0A4Z1AJM7_9LEPT|nr:type I restriction endonuclease subunit R [Leptospira dzoumogneensis]